MIILRFALKTTHEGTTFNLMKKVVVCGRPNVGKSSFINRLLGKKTAITAREAGVTRDVRYFDQVWNGKQFQICDTGGVIFSNDDTNPYQSKINDTVLNELNDAHKIILMVDFEYPNHPDDLAIRHQLKPFLTKCVLVINKVDNFDRQQALGEFYGIGIDPIFPVSALQGNGTGDVLDYLVKDMLDHVDDDAPDAAPIHVAIIGRPNVGKSSLYNAIFNDNKALVDNQMGTTRDTNESIIQVGDTVISCMDTAGLRRRRKISDTIEYFSMLRTERAIERADLIVFVVDAIDLLTDQDKKILNEIFDQSKNCMIFVNKWDQLERSDQTRKDMVRMLHYQVPRLEFYPIIMGSALIKHNIQSVLNAIVSVTEASRHRISTGPLNQFLSTFFQANHPPSKKGKLFRVYYATQVSQGPPKFVFKVNDAALITPQFSRRFERSFRAFYPNSLGVGLSFVFRSKPKV